MKTHELIPWDVIKPEAFFLLRNHCFCICYDPHLLDGHCFRRVCKREQSRSSNSSSHTPCCWIVDIGEFCIGKLCNRHSSSLPCGIFDASALWKNCMQRLLESRNQSSSSRERKGSSRC